MRGATTNGPSIGIIYCATPSQPQLRTCACVRGPAIRARHTRVKTGVRSAPCKDESEGFKAGQTGQKL